MRRDFGWESSAGRYLELYGELLRQHSSPEADSAGAAIAPE
jgi:glycogen synthase